MAENKVAPEARSYPEKIHVTARGAKETLRPPGVRVFLCALFFAILVVWVLLPFAHNRLPPRKYGRAWTTILDISTSRVEEEGIAYAAGENTIVEGRPVALLRRPAG